MWPPISRASRAWCRRCSCPQASFAAPGAVGRRARSGREPVYRGFCVTVPIVWRRIGNPYETISPALVQLGNILDPGSPLFQADAILHLSYRPDLDFWIDTDGFGRSGESSITNAIFTELDLPVDEPAPLALMAAAIAAHFVSRRRRDHNVQPCSGAGRSDRLLANPLRR